MIKKSLLGIGIAITLLLLISAFRTCTSSSRQIGDTAPSPTGIDTDRSVHNLSEALRHKTVSGNDFLKKDVSEFLRFHRFLEKTYPAVHGRLKREIINKLNILYTWKGSEESLKPILLMAHMDVVPAEASTLSRWTHPPFSGHNDGTYIWGRGALDMKPGLIGIMEAVEYLAGQGFRPKRTVYIALGCDEEQGGEEGSMLIARLLESRGVRLDFVLDEGGSILSGMIAFLAAPVAFIGIAEKGYLTLELAVESQGGHSSMPPRETPTGILCAAVARLEQSPFPARIDGVVGRMLDYLAPEAGLPARFILSNRWLFGPLLKIVMAKAPSSAAALRTTIAPTVLQGSERDNVIPSRPRALVNFRILPGETAESVTRYVIRAIGDPRVKVSPAGKSWNPSPVSSTESKEFRELQKTISQVFPGTVIAPYLVLGATDSRHYNAISDNIYRFMPYSLVQDDLDGIHGINERISVDNMKRAAEFYTRLIRNLN